MAKIEIGDVFELNTKKGKAYFQCVNKDKLRCDTIKVFNKIYTERQIINKAVEIEDYYFIGFALSAALNKNLVEKVGNISLGNFELPKYMRSKLVIGGKFLGWHIIDVKTLKRQLVETLSSEQKKLSPWGIWNDTLLKERLEKGWNLDNWD